jgi:streptomycin 6-kinase
LPAILAACAEQWAITVGPPFSLSYNYVAAATRADGTPAVIKVCTPTGEFATEAEALRLFDGRGAIRLLEVDREREAMLLERLQPGTALLAIEDDEEATVIAAAVMRKLWRPAPEGHPFPLVADWGKGFARMRARFDGGSGPLPAALVVEAERLFAELDASAAAPVVLHGDLHHENILAGGRAPWMAIDPKGLVGEPAYEPGAWLRNPRPELLATPDSGRILTRGIAILSEAPGIDRARIRDWALAQAVLSAWWNIEDHGEGWEQTIECAELLAGIRP